MWHKIQAFLGRSPTSAIMMVSITTLSVIVGITTHNETLGVQVWFASILLWVVFLFVAEVVQGLTD